MPHTVVIFGGAAVEPVPRLRRRLARLRDPYVIAADAGATTALAFGYVPRLVIGDLDSIAAETLAELERRQVPIEVFPTDKDATDGQLAMERALELQPEELLLIGYLGGPRLDQALANVLLLSWLPTSTEQVPASSNQLPESTEWLPRSSDQLPESTRQLPRATILVDEVNECRLLRGPAAVAWAAEPGEIVSLLPLSDDTRGVTTRGLRWPLADARLVRGETRGVSNEATAPTLEVRLEAGLLWVTRHLPRGV